ncbi:MULTISPECIES: LysR family transcriptional regulator [unclassified Crossiella]|uniref:LysR family transcriptional regulator n=1 Tax=unclassified Crossiella TaxID=2620835 RepID=UPI00200039F0|nr:MULTISPECIES: LysR family transcriptional regulator [unclassified Crossiella]MCK2241946.1 LysR family transcriptional regulator [Crossiella sp. S99.2]MCK2255849.1 LysR family transcriptional regulator [Crossiella sp. S99.1]
MAEELSFTRAASDRLFIAQPTLSRQIRQLETQLRTELFDRDRRTVALTPAGAALLPLARELLERWEQARRQVGEVASCCDTVLTVGFQTRIGRGLIPAVTARLGAVLPQWRLSFRQVSWTDPAAGLLDGQTDVAISWLPVPAQAGLSWKVVSTEPLWAALPVGHRLSTSDTVSFAELAGEPFVALPANAGLQRDFWLATEYRDTPARIGVEAATAEESFEAVAAGLGVSLLAAGNVELYQRPDVICRPVTGLPPAELAVIWRSEDDREAIRVFAESCVQCLCDRAA